MAITSSTAVSTMEHTMVVLLEGVTQVAKCCSAAFWFECVTHPTALSICNCWPLAEQPKDVPAMVLRRNTFATSSFVTLSC